MAEEKDDKKPKKKHLHEIRTVAAHDGTYVHHHTYKDKPEDSHHEPERENVATSQNADEAGEHVAEQMGMNAPPQDPGAAPDATPAPAPDAGASPAGA